MVTQLRLAVAIAAIRPEFPASRTGAGGGRRACIWTSQGYILNMLMQNREAI